MGKIQVTCLIPHPSKGPVQRSNLPISIFSVHSISFEESLFDSLYLVGSITISFNGKKITTPALLDCYATGIAFIDIDSVSQHKIPNSRLSTPGQINIRDRRPISSGEVTVIVCLTVSIQNHAKILSLFLITLQYPIVPAISCLVMHDVFIYFSSYNHQFDNKNCKESLQAGKITTGRTILNGTTSIH